jgi:hypothetical protein
MFDLEKYHFREAAITTAAVGAGLGLFQAYQGMKDKNDAKSALNNFKRQDLTNPYINMPISTVGTDAMREEASRTNANLIDASQGDIRSVMGNLPRIVSLGNELNRGIQTELDGQVQRRNYAIAGDEVAQRGMQEARDNGDLAGIGQQLQVGRQDMWNGLRGVAASASYGMNNSDAFANKTPQVEGVTSGITPVGVKSLTPKPMANPSGYLDSFNKNFYGY